MAEPTGPRRAVAYREIEAKTITRLRGTVDPWFLGRYGMNLYRGCEHGCAYCDGRAERYYVEGDFARDIVVKRNALEILRRELARAPEPGFVFLGGGVCDAYQPAEVRYRLARGALELALERRLPVHLLTKSNLVERDLDLLVEINRRTRAILSFSIQTADDAVRERFEPVAASIGERLRLLRRARNLGLGVGAMAMPVLPGISDRPADIDRLVGMLADAGADFVCFGGLTLRPGVQKRTYLEVVARCYPELLDGYQRAYRSERASGAPDPRYLARVDERFLSSLQHHGLPGRIPRRLFHGQMPLYAEVGVMLEHSEFQRRATDQRGGGLARAGCAIQEWARQRMTRRGGRRGLSFQEVEHEFRGLVQDGGLLNLEEVTPGALDEVRQLLVTD